MIPVRVLFFASLREAVGREEVFLELPDSARIDDLLASLDDILSAEAMAALRAENVRLAVNQEMLTAPGRLRPNDEVAFLPPVTGG
ncbi:MAG TPA: MoaD/ThiS family protein [Pseudomonadales bacterium]